jgi:hypothetical protein
VATPVEERESKPVTRSIENVIAALDRCSLTLLEKPLSTEGRA